MNWDDYFTGLLAPVAQKSKDPSRKVSAIITGPNHEIRSTGFNGMPRGCEELPHRTEKPEKYLWYEHAERNAIYNAARHGASLDGCTLYVSLFPCVDCARAIVQVGITRVVAPAPNLQDPQWGAGFERALEMFNEAKIETKSTPQPEEPTSGS